VSCNAKLNKAGQEGIVPRPSRLNIIHAVFSKQTGDQDVALTERASRLRRRSLPKRRAYWDSEGWGYGLHDGPSGSRATCGIRTIPNGVPSPAQEMEKQTAWAKFSLAPGPLAEHYQENVSLIVFFNFFWSRTHRFLNVYFVYESDARVCR
jgi:hypothetical protein